MSEKQQLTKVLESWLSGWFSVFCGKTLLPLFCHPVVKFFHCFGNGFAGCRKVPRQRHIAEHKTLGGIGENVVNAVPTVINVIEHKEDYIAHMQASHELKTPDDFYQLLTDDISKTISSKMTAEQVMAIGKKAAVF